MIQIRNVPDDVHRVFKMRAAEAGLSLSDYLLRELTPIAERPTVEELLKRIAAEPVINFSEATEDILREAREERGIVFEPAARPLRRVADDDTWP